MTRWERLEEYLYEYDKDGSDFTVHEYVDAANLDSTYEGTADIQAYLGAQRSTNSKTLYVLRRQPGTRTVNSRWAVGVKSKDARLIGKGFFDDTKSRWLNAVHGDLVRLGTINPQARRLVEAQTDAVVEGAIRILEVAVMGQSDES